MELPSAIVTLGTMRPEDKKRASGRLGMPGPVIGLVKGNTLKKHHALLPQPHIIICTAFTSSMDCTVFIVLG